MIFTDFDRDVDDPDAYDFQLTDEYMRVIELSGAKVFYRLGSKIEHWSKKYNTLPPKDFHKWAQVCEHIIRHYNEGWADGFHMNIEYWEIWNEPDLDPDDATHKRCWGGTAAQFYELYNITAVHLKKCFPNLKIGGPAVAGLKEAWLRPFFAGLAVKPDFFSWHVYACTIEKVREKIRYARTLLDEYGMQDVESILNEWNYVRGWHDDVWLYSLKAEKGLKGSSFIAATMAMSQYEPLDNLMFYDARPGGMNSLYCTDRINECLKGYYPFYMFNTLYKLGTSVESTSDSEYAYVTAASNESEAALMLTHYADDDDHAAEDFLLDLRGFASERGVELELFVLDESNDLTPAGKLIYYADRIAPTLTLPNFTSYLIKLKKL